MPLTESARRFVLKYLSRDNEIVQNINVVKAGPESKPKKATVHGSHGRTGRTDGWTGSVIIKGNMIFLIYLTNRHNQKF